MRAADACCWADNTGELGAADRGLGHYCWIWREGMSSRQLSGQSFLKADEVFLEQRTYSSKFHNPPLDSAS
jgi:hypothetical protein